MTLTAIGLALALASAPQEAPRPAADSQAQTASSQGQTLSSDAIARGQTQLAIQRLEDELKGQPDDPALLINLGIALAHTGDEAGAQAMFERALVSSKPLSLETAEGKLVDSRRLARQAMRMLERGEFSGN